MVQPMQTRIADTSILHGPSFLRDEESQNRENSITLKIDVLIYRPAATGWKTIYYALGSQMTGNSFWRTFAPVTILLAAGLFVTVTSLVTLNAASLVAGNDTCTYHACISLAANN